MLLFFLNDKMFDFITKHYNVENTKKKKYLFFLLWFLILGGLTKIFFPNINNKDLIIHQYQYKLLDDNYYIYAEDRNLGKKNIN